MKSAPARLYLLPAKSAPIVGVIRRKPTNCCHVLKWNTQTDEITPGSWVGAKIFPHRSDVSFDGEWMVYLSSGEFLPKNGICRLPWLEDGCEVDNIGVWRGGGFWTVAQHEAGECEPVLMLNDWSECFSWTGRPREEFPFRMVDYEGELGDAGVLYRRLERDGWRQEGVFWQWQPTPEHPMLRLFHRGFSGRRGYVYEFRLDGYPKLLNERVTWARWDSLGQLVVGRAGVLEKWTLADLATGKPSFTFDLNPLEPPARSRGANPETGGIP